MRKLWEEMLYFLRQKPFVIFAALTAAGSYGFAITHEGIGVDDTMAGVYLDEGLEPYMGRWTVYLVNKLFRIGEFTPFITELMGCLLLMAGVLLFCVLLRRIFGERVGTAGYTVFACVFLSCPFISDRRLRNVRTRINTGFFLLQNKTTPHWFMVKLSCPETINHPPRKELYLYDTIQTAFFGRYFYRLPK